MIVRDIKSIIGSDHDVHGSGWNSRRLLVRDDGMGYTMTDTIVKAGTEMTLEYKNHLEACYCISGSGEIEDHASGQIHQLFKGVIYALDKNDYHTLRVHEGADMNLICTFTPALTGQEVHGPDGSYS
ncbi:ectoine synthase [Amylibacter sp. SFDW26]|uniref:ectoine synthase n=1 Tax=Amylibacter sp. SFDW26 TaxID=2652722 RepID=UPI00126144A7|nr:ectoine synthase [Amylibacter sp. SFDW26]KAB7614636.1 ectoine synthase [Amylibacter sp. SFDW26]